PNAGIDGWASLERGGSSAARSIPRSLQRADWSGCYLAASACAWHRASAAPNTRRLAPAVGEVRADAELDRHPLYLARRAAPLRAPLRRRGITEAARRLPARACAQLPRLPRPSRHTRASRRGGTG